MNVNPLSKTSLENLTKMPENITKSPFIDLNAHKRSLEDENNGYFFDQSSKRIKNDVPPPSYICNICNQPGHWIKNCPIAQKKKKEIPEGYICRICNQSGHWISDCPEKNQKRNTNSLSENYICRRCNKPGHHIRDCPENKKKRGKRIKIQEDDQCWFCLSNPNVTKHLIVSIGDESYLALAKGGLLEDGSHFLIIPITHIPCNNNLINAPPDEEEEIDKDALLEEMGKYKKILSDYYQSHENKKIICFEVYGGFDGKKYRHMHIQVVPVPENIEQNIESSFIAEAEKNDLIQSDYPTDFHEAYIRVELANGKSLIFTKKNT